jgi:diguanylate cyclase (GGDEF)-like protein/PAS domain S-box-containing protein
MELVALWVAAALVAGGASVAAYARLRALANRLLNERRYSVLESIRDGMFIVDDRLRFTHVNEKAEELLHRTAAELVGRRVEKVLDALASDLVPELRAVRASGTPIERTQLFPASNRWIEIRMQPAAGEVLVHLRDVSASMHAETMLRESERRLRLLLEQVPALLWTVDLEMRFTSVVGAWLVAHGLNESELTSHGIDYILPSDRLRDVALSAIRRVFDGDSERFETLILGRWMQHHVEPLRNADGTIVGAIGVALDITEMKETSDQLARLARIDTLTELPNRFALEEAMDAALARAIADEAKLGVLFVDLDRFKVINDTLGHRAGDELLRRFAARLRRAVDARASVFRSGGDEFIVILELDGTTSVPMIAADIQIALAEPFTVADRQLIVSASIGSSTYPEDGTSVEELLSRADSAMYHAKYSGRSRVGFFDITGDDAAPYRLRLEQDLHYAIARGEFHLMFQPIVDVSTTQVVGAEALLRWTHSKHGEIYPEEFIAIAEETGMIVEISRWVLRAACELAVECRARGNPDFRMSVNLSARDFAEARLADDVRRTLAETGLPAQALEIEITESIIIDEVAMRTLRTLRAMGVRVVIDDFGVAYSSLGYLKRLPISGVKIDRTFIREVHSDRSGQAIVRAIVTLARSLELDVVVEGVESLAQWSFVSTLSCDRAQGYLFSQPVAPECLLELPRSLLAS